MPYAMLDIFSLLCLTGAVITLVILAVIDLKTYLLPNKWVMTLAVLGIIFHITSSHNALSPLDMALGALAGFLSLYVIRFIANLFYKEDALGLGDVKLMGAGGLWLGPEMIMMAMAVGATASLVHGIFVGWRQAYKENEWPDFSRLRIPAGPGFVFGLLTTGTCMYSDFFGLF